MNKTQQATLLSTIPVILVMLAVYYLPVSDMDEKEQTSDTMDYSVPGDEDSFCFHHPIPSPSLPYFKLRESICGTWGNVTKTLLSRGTCQGQYTPECYTESFLDDYNLVDDAPRRTCQGQHYPTCYIESSSGEMLLFAPSVGPPDYPAYPDEESYCYHYPVWSDGESKASICGTWENVTKTLISKYHCQGERHYECPIESASGEVTLFSPLWRTIQPSFDYNDGPFCYHYPLLPDAEPRESICDNTWVRVTATLLSRDHCIGEPDYTCNIESSSGQTIAYSPLLNPEQWHTASWRYDD